MARRKTSPAKGSSAASKAAAKPEAEKAEAAGTQPPVVYRKRKRRKKKRRYSRGLRDVQRLGLGVVRASDRLTDAVAAGVTTFRKESNKSSRKRRDGAIRDALDNWSSAMSETIRKSADAPLDITRKVSTRRFGKQVRDVVRLLPNPFPFLR